MTLVDDLAEMAKYEDQTERALKHTKTLHDVMSRIRDSLSAADAQRDVFQEAHEEAHEGYEDADAFYSRMEEAFVEYIGTSTWMDNVADEISACSFARHYAFFKPPLSGRFMSALALSAVVTDPDAMYTLLCCVNAHERAETEPTSVQTFMKMLRTQLIRWRSK